MLLYVALCFFTGVKAFNSQNAMENSSFKELINQTQIKHVILHELKDAPDANLMYLKMFDASTKIPSGFLLGGSFYDLGNFDECYNIRGANNTVGKYCLGEIPVGDLTDFIHSNPEKSDILRTEVREVTKIVYHWALCVPSTLPVDVLNENGIFKFQEETCRSKDTEPSLSTGATLTIITLAFFLAISTLSTMYDIFLFYTHRKAHHELLVAFSYLTNGKKLIKSNNSPDHLPCLNGIRAISMMWIVLAHVYMVSIHAAISDISDFLDWMKDTANMSIRGASVAVDTFFALGGLVTTYTFLSAMDKGQKFNIFTYYLHRYLRLTPAYGIAILVYYNLLTHLGNGPLWYMIEPISAECEDGWWKSLLYIANFLKGECVSQTWYLHVDMQLFFFSPLVLIPLVKWRKWAFAELGVLAVAGILVPFFLGYFGQVTAPGLRIREDRYTYYIMPYARFGPYVLGMITGMLICDWKKGNISKTINMWIVWILWIGCVAVLPACVYAGYNFKDYDELGSEKPLGTDGDFWANGLFLAFNRNGWALAVCIIIYLCVSGYGGPVNYFLSFPIFQFISKLSYSIYLVHCAVITVIYASGRHNTEYSNSAVLFSFCGHFMVTVAISVVLCLTCESPTIIIEKWLFARGKTPKKSEKSELAYNNEKYDFNIRL